MKQIERNLLLSTEVMIEESESLMEIIERYPTDKVNVGRKQTISENIGRGLGFLKALKMITCDHNKGKGNGRCVSCRSGVTVQPGREKWLKQGGKRGLTSPAEG